MPADTATYDVKTHDDEKGPVLKSWESSPILGYGIRPLGAGASLRRGHLLFKAKRPSIASEGDTAAPNANAH